jgi:hypothetical protein
VPIDSGLTSDWHRHFGASLFNAAWELIDRPNRSPDDDVEMLLAAAASRWHWGRVGGHAEVATGDWQLAHVASLLGMSELALVFARRNLEAATSSGWAGWRLASAHEGMARACAAAGDADGRAEHFGAAERALAGETDAEDARVIAGQLATVPQVD